MKKHHPTSEQLAIIKANSTKPVADIAKLIGKSYNRTYSWMKELNLLPFQKSITNSDKFLDYSVHGLPFLM